MASWKPVLDAVLDLYDDVSTLLRDLDYQMDRYGHGCLHPRHYGYEGTAALERPRTWLPTWLSRVYARHQEQAPRRLLAVSVVLHPEGLEVLNPNWTDPQSPILLASALRYREPPGDRWELRHGLLWLSSDAPLDGAVHRIGQNPAPLPPLPSAGTGAPGRSGTHPVVATAPPQSLIDYADVLALPLESLRTGEDLRNLVIDPLRRLV